MRFTAVTHGLIAWSTSMTREEGIETAARLEALNAIVLCLVKTHPDKAAFVKTLEAAAQVAFDALSASKTDDSEREHAQQSFDRVISNAVKMAQG